MDLKARAKDNNDSAQRFDWTALVLLDQQSAEAKCITALEVQVQALVGVIGRLQQQRNQRAKALELQAREDSAEQDAELAGLRNPGLEARTLARASHL